MQGWVDPKMGSTSVVTNASGGVVGTQGYYPFGETRYTSGSLFTDKLFTGQQMAGLGLYNYRARYYDPALGRFLSPDSLTPGGVEGLNRYSYTFNNPINYVDPSGHKACDEVDANGKCIKYSSGSGDIVNFKAEDGKSWSKTETQYIQTQYEAVARRLAHMDGGGFSISLFDAFTSEFGGPITVMKKNKTCSEYHDNNPSFTAEAENMGGNMIFVYSNATNITTTHLLVHELGHEFFYNHPTTVPADLMRPIFKDDNEDYIMHVDPTTNLTYGYYAQSWQFGFQSSNANGEELADMFVGWVYGKWENSQLGRTRIQFMNGTMNNILR
jgi:RHS repeat-associated protein